MKKLFIYAFFCTSSLGLAQVNVVASTADFNEIYEGGKIKMKKDLQKNYSRFSSDFQANGRFTLTFDIDENSNILKPIITPDIDHDFSRELIRTFKRVKNNFKTEISKKNLAIVLDFNTDYKETDGRLRFTEVPPRQR